MTLYTQAFEVRDTKPLSNIVPHLIFAAAIATPLILALTHPPFQKFIEDQPRGTLQQFIIAMSLPNLAFAIDIIGLVLNLFSRKPALRLTEHGAEGLYGWLNRRFHWEDIDHVAVGLNHLQLVRRANNPVFGLLQLMRAKGDKRRASDQIYVKLSTADRELDEILFEIEKRCPGMQVISSPFLKSPAKARRAEAQP